MRPVLLALALAACGGGTDDEPAQPDASATPDAPAGCTRPDLGGLRPRLQATLAGLPAPRATATQRDAARAYLQGELAALGASPMLHTYATGANVLATFPATTGDRPPIVVGAHFDTVSGSPGANDNASGVAVVLAVAQVVAAAPCRESPVTIALFDQEELGLFGSRAYAQSLVGTELRAVHTIDQVSWDDDGDRVFELERPTAALEAEWRAAAAIVGVPVTVTPTEGTDHEPFRDAGFPAVGLTEEFVGGDTSPFRHTAQDTAQTVELDYLDAAARLTAQVVLDELEP